MSNACISHQKAIHTQINNLYNQNISYSGFQELYFYRCYLNYYGRFFCARMFPMKSFKYTVKIKN